MAATISEDFVVFAGYAHEEGLFIDR